MDNLKTIIVMPSIYTTTSNTKCLASKLHKQVHYIIKGERQSLYRDRDQIQNAKEIKGGISVANWFLKGQMKSTVSCQATPNGSLADQIRKAIGQTRDGQQNIILGDGGVPVPLSLKQKDPFLDNSCKQLSTCHQRKLFSN